MFSSVIRLNIFSLNHERNFLAGSERLKIVQSYLTCVFWKSSIKFHEIPKQCVLIRSDGPMSANRYLGAFFERLNSIKVLTNQEIWDRSCTKTRRNIATLSEHRYLVVRSAPTPVGTSVPLYRFILNLVIYWSRTHRKPSSWPAPRPRERSLTFHSSSKVMFMGVS